MSTEAWISRCGGKVASAAEAVARVRSGARVVVGHACGEPLALTRELAARGAELRDVEIVHMVPMAPSPFVAPAMAGSFRHNALFVGKATREAIAQGRADYTPCFFSEVPRLIRDGFLPVDVALIQVTPPDAEGFCSYGVSADYTVAAAENAEVVIAQVNERMPRTGGARIHVDWIDAFVASSEDLIELPRAAIGEVERAIGQHVASLVPDGATLQLGIGAIPDSALLFLKDKKDLGIHSEMFSDGVVELVEAGAVTNARKTLNPGRFVATFLMGTRKLYDFVDGNPSVELRPVDYVNDPYVIGQHDAMVSINSALQVDLMGQVNAEAMGRDQFSGVGGQVDFIRGASRSRGGRSIVALPSTAAKGSVSRIVATLDPGSPVTTSRNDVHYVVTEYGIAELRGKTLRERARALIGIAHPDFRTALSREAGLS